MKLLFPVLAVAFLAAACTKKQEVVFEATSVRWRGMIGTTEDECKKASRSIQQYLGDGWRIVSSSPKELVVNHGEGRCIGTEYVIEK
ncbi:hypothetical protein [Ramlibacter alkalitolerans]|uniref:DUF4177 domain-containing protein n=1 Tax=Ramlibacter alkalitolerans TaxID=2039631 RepID=A0ABS1JWT5_9BURK|nr:hypothetical protein [Ramlibacter alkalitolerans]MBL0428748.1 hypothetical protein [Ramlibacter alkalitolerans]